MRESASRRDLFSPLVPGSPPAQRRDLSASAGRLAPPLPCLLLLEESGFPLRRDDLMPDATIEFRSVDFCRAGDSVLRQFDLEVSPGQTFALIGRSGCGKTTTLKLVNSLLRPTSGQVIVGGRETSLWDPIKLRRSIGYVIQEVGLFPHLTVAENIGVVPSLEGWKKKQIDARVEELMGRVGLNPPRFAHRFPDELSGGQRQRVGVARALALDPPILLMDEPFGALDPLTRSQLQREFGSLQQELQKTVLLVTHDLGEALLLGSRVGLLEQGRLVFQGSPQDVLASSDPVLREFLVPFQALESLWNN